MEANCESTYKQEINKLMAQIKIVQTCWCISDPMATHQFHRQYLTSANMTGHLSYRQNKLISIFLIEMNFTANAEQGLDSSNNVRKRATLSFYPKQYKLDCAIPLISSLSFLPDLIITESAKDE